MRILETKKIFFIQYRIRLLQLFFFILTGLTSRIIYLQIIDSDRLEKIGNTYSTQIDEISTDRGIITDRFGKFLAMNVPTYSVYLDPKEINRNQKILKNKTDWESLSRILSIPLKKLLSYVQKNPKSSFVYLSRQIDLDSSKNIKKLKIPGIYLKKESKRFYPNGEITSHLVGITNIDNQGIEGIEKSFNNLLTGQSGKKKVKTDLFGRIIEKRVLLQAKQPKDLRLSIDLRLQFLAYREIKNAVKHSKAESGSIILIDIRTGEILAIANSPSYDPNQINKTSLKNMKNRSIADSLEPGSTVKPIVILAALKSGIIHKNSIVDTTPYSINKHQIKDLSQEPRLSITEILKRSSNTGISKIALSMPSSFLKEIYLGFGFGSKTNSGMFGESNGYFPSNRKWSNLDKASLSYGYGLMVTPIQLARAYSIIGNMGITRSLSIIQNNSPRVGERIFPKILVRNIIEMMENVSLPGGSGEKAFIKGYRIAIKTGTVKKLGKEGKYINRYIAYTAGIAPSRKPRFTLVVVINDPKIGKYYGGEISAPVFKSVMSGAFRFMNIKPDSSFSKKKFKLH